MQLTFFVFLPSIPLSGFMFPFEGMPVIAQRAAVLWPLTHFVDELQRRHSARKESPELSSEP